MFLFSYSAKTEAVPALSAWKFLSNSLEDGMAEAERRLGGREMRWGSITPETGYSGFGAVVGAHHITVIVENLEVL